MKLKDKDYKKKLKNIAKESNIEIDNVNWKIVFVVTTLVGGFLFFGIAFANNLIEYNGILAEKNAILADIKGVEDEIEELKVLQEESQMLSFVEKQAREKLKMVRTDETVYIDLSE